MSVYTKTGDGGTTGLLTGERIDKASLKVEAYGTVDEFNSALAMARAFCQKDSVKAAILALQKINMLLMADLASTGESTYTNIEHIKQLESAIDEAENSLPPLTSFIVPGESKGGAALDLARTTARRAERRIWQLCESEPIEKRLPMIMNRMSDYCFVLMRMEEENNNL
jgi:cob(I)alamin adenosyltransferase